MNVHFYAQSIRNHGVAASVRHATYRALSQVAHLLVVRGVAVTADALPEATRAAPPGVTGAFVSYDEAARLTCDPGFALSSRFVEAARARGDRCFVVRANEAPVSYCWYADRAAPLRETLPELEVRFASGWAYAFNAVTHPDARGRGYHPIGKALAVTELARRGQYGALSFIEASNCASQKSCARQGGRVFGRAVVARAGGRYVSWASPGCDAFGFAIAQAAAS